MNNKKTNMANNSSHPAASRPGLFSRLHPHKLRGWVAGVGLAVMALTSFIVVGQSGPPSIPAVNLPNEPLFGASTNEKPAMALALSVEFPTVGAQYRGASDYSPSTEYIGYYDAGACYTYNNAPTETPRTGLTSANYKRFDRTGAASNRKCTGETFSGNFLNWASNSAIDMLRLALSGGDRYIDEENLTILQRAILPDGDPSNFWNNSSYFPAKQLPRSVNGINDYAGAVPESMRTTANNDGKIIWIANKLNGIYFRANASSSNSSDYKLGGNLTGGDNFFYSRVQVCNSSGGTLLDNRDYGLCKKYPSGYYKPTGVIQKYSDQLRLAAFGYLMDQTDPKTTNSTASFGGVLRAPMKYVGAKTFDINGQYVGANDKAEWDERTGEFIENPENNQIVTSPRADVSPKSYSNGVSKSSGVINYLNKFGRTGPTFGRYKQYDPVGELHYEVVRYLQGLNPTPLAVSKITGSLDSTFALRDGFPAYTTWADPYGDGRSPTADYSCVKSNIVVVGDMNTHDGNRFPAADVAKNIFSATDWRNIVVKFETKSGGTYVDGQGNSQNITNPNATNADVPNSNDRSKLMGSAYWSHTHDIRGTTWTDAVDKQRPGLRVKNFFFDVNENSASTNQTYRRTKNQFFMASKYGGFESDPANLGGNPYNTYGNPFYNEKSNPDSADNKVWQEVDTVKFPARAGEASTFYLQSDARQVLSAFDEIFNRSSTKASSIAKPGANSTTIKVGSTPLIYQGRFDTGDWSGDVEAKGIAMTLATDGTPSYTYTPVWSAAARLAALSSPATSRNIVIGTNTGAVDFSAATTFSFVTANEVKYLRGDQSLEGTTIDGSTTWRKRSSLLGDVVNSGIVYSGAPSKQISDAGYKDFYTDNKDRTPAVFVGANDGMLHAFNATTGDELFAYIPKTMSSKLSALTRSTFIGNHQTYVDGLITVAEAKIGTAGTKADWKTVLVAANGSGARGVFALDVTNPSAFSANKAMWEFTSADDSSMGYVVGQPQILKMRTSASPKTYKWFAVVASGVNNYVNDGAGNYSTTGEPAIFFLALDKDPGAAWSLGSNYYKISLPVDATAKATKPAAVANFTPLLDGDGVVKEIFVGDYHGNIWNFQFNIRSSIDWRGTSDWTAYKLSPFQKSSAPYPLYIAKDAAGNRQVIHEAPVILNGPVVNERETFFVFAGTGKLIESADKGSAVSQSIYAVYDDGTTTPDDSSTPVAIKGRARLKAGTVNVSAKTVTVDSFTWGRPDTDGDTSKRAGWYADLPTTGERVVGVIQTLGRKAIFNTQIPTVAGSSGGCAAGASTTNTYTVDVPTGSGTFVSRPGPESTVLLFEDNTPSAITETVSDPTGRRVRTKTFRSISTGQGASGSESSIQVKELLGRLSWRYINNYQDLKNKASE